MKKIIFFVLYIFLTAVALSFANDDDLNLSGAPPWGPPMVVQTNKALEMTGHRMPQLEIQTKTLEITGRRQEPLVLNTKALEFTGWAGKNPPEPVPTPAPILPMTTSTVLTQNSLTKLQPKKIITYPLEMTGTAGQTAIQTFNIGNFAGMYKGKSEARTAPTERTEENISQSDMAKRNRAAARAGGPAGGFSQEEQGGQIQ